MEILSEAAIKGREPEIGSVQKEILFGHDHFQVPQNLGPVVDGEKTTRDVENLSWRMGF